MTWVKSAAGRVNLSHVEEVTVVGTGPYTLQARLASGQTTALLGPQDNYPTVADALAALDAALGPARFGGS